MKATSKSVQNAIEAKTGDKVLLKKSDGCWYFTDADDAPKEQNVSSWHTTTVYVMYLRDLPISRWVEEYEDFKKMYG